jgi:hypothetical protein
MEGRRSHSRRRMKERDRPVGDLAYEFLIALSTERRGGLRRPRGNRFMACLSGSATRDRPATSTRLVPERRSENRPE